MLIVLSLLAALIRKPQRSSRCRSTPAEATQAQVLALDEIVRDLDLLRPIYAQTAAYGHFGRSDLDLPWERLDKVDDLKNSV